MTLGNIAAFATDKEAEVSGIWVTVEHGIRLCVARMNNPKYLALLRQLMIPHRQQLRNVGGKRYRKDNEVQMDDVVLDDKSDALMQRIQKKAMARYVLLGWENLAEPKLDENQEPVLDDEGQPVLVPVEYSEERAYEFLDQLSTFYEIVLEIANDESLYREETHAETVGNS